MNLRDREKERESAHNVGYMTRLEEGRGENDITVF